MMSFCYCSGMYNGASLDATEYRPSTDSQQSVAAKPTFSYTMKMAVPEKLRSSPGWRNPLRKEAILGWVRLRSYRIYTSLRECTFLYKLKIQLNKTWGTLLHALISSICGIDRFAYLRI